MEPHAAEHGARNNYGSSSSSTAPPAHSGRWVGSWTSAGRAQPAGHAHRCGQDATAAAAPPSAALWVGLQRLRTHHMRQLWLRCSVAWAIGAPMNGPARLTCWPRAWRGTAGAALGIAWPRLVRGCLEAHRPASGRSWACTRQSCIFRNTIWTVEQVCDDHSKRYALQKRGEGVYRVFCPCCPKALPSWQCCASQQQEGLAAGNRLPVITISCNPPVAALCVADGPAKRNRSWLGVGGSALRTLRGSSSMTTKR